MSLMIINGHRVYSQTTDRDKMFALHVENWERNRMCPPRYRKESPMIKLNMAHVNAICHAEFYLDGAISHAQNARERKQLEDDLLKLAELKISIIQQMTGVGKLFNMQGSSDGDQNSA